MKNCLTLLIAVLGACLATFAQTSPMPSRVVVTNTMPPVQPARSPTPKPVQTPIVVGTAAYPSQASNLNYKGLSFAAIKAKLAEAKRQMMTRPLTTASTEPVIAGFNPIAPASLVRIAYYDWRTRSTHYVTVAKDAFLSANVPTAALSTTGRMVTARTIRANGVNTPIEIKDENGQNQLPLMIQYPVEKKGRFVETAYYMSTHPGIVTPEVVNAGRLYVRNVIDIARENLRLKGYATHAKIVDIAERLATVEHVDHLRFRTEFHPNIYNDIFTLYALNEGQTYRYSVSSAGAGGMVQMIPSTYRMIRARYPSAALVPDFVDGMRNHVNAAQAMLLYMQMTWNDLSASPTVVEAMRSGIATQEQLMSAGYNSNPARLPKYIARGGAGWTSLIPRETQIYLQIYSSLERAVPMAARKQ